MIILFLFFLFLFLFLLLPFFDITVNICPAHTKDGNTSLCLFASI